MLRVVSSLLPPANAPYRCEARKQEVKADDRRGKSGGYKGVGGSAAHILRRGSLRRGPAPAARDGKCWKAKTEIADLGKKGQDSSKQTYNDRSSLIPHSELTSACRAFQAAHPNGGGHSPSNFTLVCTL